MRVSPFRVNAHQVSEKRDAAHNQAARGELCISATSGRSPIPPCSPSRLVALSRCPDAMSILEEVCPLHHGTKVTRGNRECRELGLSGDATFRRATAVQSRQVLQSTFSPSATDAAFTP